MNRPFASIVCLGLALLAAGWFYEPACGSKFVLLFAQPAERRARDTNEDGLATATAGWASPGELAVRKLLDSSLPQEICRFLETRTEPQKQKGLREAYSLLEENRISARTSEPTWLEVEIFEPDPKLAQLYAYACIDYLEKSLIEEKSRGQANSQILSDLSVSLDVLTRQEEKLVRGLSPQVLSNPVALNFALDHYREALQRRDASVSRQKSWMASTESMAPSFVVLSGPTPFRSKRPLLKWTLGISGLILLAAAGAEQLRQKSGKSLL